MWHHNCSLTCAWITLSSTQVTQHQATFSCTLSTSGTVDVTSTIIFIFTQTHGKHTVRQLLKFAWVCVTLLMITLIPRSHAFFHSIRREVKSTVHLCCGFTHYHYTTPIVLQFRCCSHTVTSNPETESVWCVYYCYEHCTLSLIHSLLYQEYVYRMNAIGVCAVSSTCQLHLRLLPLSQITEFILLISIGQ